MKDIKYIIIILIFIFGGCDYYTKYSSHKEPIINGIMNLHSYDFTKGPLKLDGLWSFYKGIFLKPGSTLKPSCFLNYPGQWKDQKCDNTNLSARGHGSYRLFLEVKKNHHLMLKIGEIYTSSQIIINGKIVKKAGEPGPNTKKSIPGWMSGHISIFPQKDFIELIIHVSNYHYYKGGPNGSIYIGHQKDLLKIWERSLIVNLALFGILLFMGLYHLIFYYSKRTDRSLMYFGLLCIIIAVYHFITAESSNGGPFDGTTWVVVLKITYLMIYCGPIILSFYINSLFPLDFKKIYVRVILIICSLFSITVFMSSDQYSGLLKYFHYILIIMSIIISVVIIKILMKKRKGSVFFIIGITLFIIAVLNDILYYQGIIETFDSISYGLLALIVSQSILLSQRYSSFSARLELLEIERMELQNEINQKNSSSESIKSISPQIEEKMNKVQFYINNNFKEDISREGLAAMIDIHPDTFSRMFKLHYKMRFGDYIHMLRIKEAVNMLQNSDLNILEVALETGFDSLRTFNRAFKRQMNCTPSEFRNQINEII